MNLAPERPVTAAAPAGPGASPGGGSVGKDAKLVMNGTLALRDALTKTGITHTFRETDGRHEWVVWRHHLREVAPLLFH